MTHQTKLKMERKCKQEKGQTRETPSPEKKEMEGAGHKEEKEAGTETPETGNRDKPV